jgi:hypothetical protein
LVDFLEFPRGELTKDLLAMSRPGLRTKLRTTCRSAMREGKTISAADVRVNRGGHYFKCSITVSISFFLGCFELVLKLFHFYTFYVILQSFQQSIYNDLKDILYLCVLDRLQ